MAELKKFFLLDALALIYRAHFAFSKNPRINSKGMNTGAVLGFTNTLLDVINKEKPTHIGVAFDTAAPTFRHEAFKEYKATRQEQPEDIQTAIPYVKQLLGAFRIPVLEMDGYEADDIIGTLAKKAAPEGFRVFMMTMDKDYAQLVEESIFLYKPAYMGNAIDILGITEVLKKFEIAEVDQVRDILGLQGDSVDNIPGVPGVGAKTAVKLIGEYGSVENLVNHAGQLSGKLKDNLIRYKDQALLSKELATIYIHVPMKFEAEAFRYVGPDKEKLKQLFEELEFRTLAKRIWTEENLSGSNVTGQLTMFDSSVKEEEAKQETTLLKKNITSVKHDYKILDEEKEIRQLAGELNEQEEFCFDTETTGLDPIQAELVGLAISFKPGTAYYIPFPADKDQSRERLDIFQEIFLNKKILKIGQNIKYDWLVLKNYGIQVEGPFFDTMLAHYLIDPETRHNMDVLAENYLNYTPVPIEELIGKKGKEQETMREVDINRVAEYAGEDADITLQLKQVFEPLLKEKRLEPLFYEVEIPLIEVLASMEEEGIRIDTDSLSILSAELEKDCLVLENQIFELAGEKFNISSPRQLGEILFDKLQLIDQPKKTKTGQYATGEEILSRLAGEHRIAAMILDFRELQKLKSTYVDALPALMNPVDGRVHTSFNQTVAATGRLSSTNPNLQNIPVRTERGREIRKAFIPRDEEHILLSADYSQIELRIMASYSMDASMIQAFHDGLDIHAMTASRIFNVPLKEVNSDMRRKAKTANFGIIYGISSFGLSERLNISRKEATEIIDAYFRQFPSVKDYMNRVIGEAREKQYVETMLGRRRYLRDINSRNQTMRGIAERNAINTPIQGSAADLIKIAMIRIQDFIKDRKLKSRMILQVHDELIFDVYKPELETLRPAVEDRMKNALKLAVPVEVDSGIGDNWLEAH